MNKKVFYYFGLGIGALLTFILVFVPGGKRSTQDHQGSAMTGNFFSGKQDNAIIATGDQEKTSASQPFAPFRHIKKGFNQLGINTKTVDINVKEGQVKWSAKSKWGKYFGQPASNLYPIQPKILKQHHVMKAKPKAIQGCYQTKWGPMRLYNKKDIVMGIFSFKGGGYITGKLKDNLFVGIWVRPGKNKLPMKSGTFQFAFTENFTSFQGVWGNTKEASLNKALMGKKIKCPAKRTKQTGIPGKAKQPIAKPKQIAEEIKSAQPVDTISA